METLALFAFKLESDRRAPHASVFCNYSGVQGEFILNGEPTPQSDALALEVRAAGDVSCAARKAMQEARALEGEVALLLASMSGAACVDDVVRAKLTRLLSKVILFRMGLPGPSAVSSGVIP